MPKGVLFDLDGTLLDSAPDFIASLDNLLTKYNQPKSKNLQESTESRKSATTNQNPKINNNQPKSENLQQSTKIRKSTTINQHLKI